MKKLPLIITAVVCLTLVSCGKDGSDSDKSDITSTTEIESKAQSKKVCAPFIKYLECSLEKAPETKKSIHQKILDDTKQKIENDEPARIAQQCDAYIKVLKENPEIAFRNGCVLDGYTMPTNTPKTTVPTEQPKK